MYNTSGDEGSEWVVDDLLDHQPSVGVCSGVGGFGALSRNRFLMGQHRQSLGGMGSGES